MKATITVSIDTPRNVSVSQPVEAEPEQMTRALAEGFKKAVEALQGALVNGHGVKTRSTSGS
jgi:hypothetical protein